MNTDFAGADNQTAKIFVKQVNSFEELKPYQQEWDRLAGDNLFLSWAWLSTWWNYYKSSNRLHVLLFFNQESDSIVSDDASMANKLVGVLPTYIETSVTQGKVVRLLGDGEICTDHLDVIADKQDLKRIASATAQYFVVRAELWDSTAFNAVGEDCEGLNLLGREFQKLGCQVSNQANVNRWSIPLPKDWESFLGMLSKSHRKKLRRLGRNVLETDRAKWHRVETVEQFETAWPILIDLHQRRRVSLGERGCFASMRWASFHTDMARQLLHRGQLRLSWLELDGTPVAAEYQLSNGDTTFAYQGGLDPDRLDEQPGRLSLFRCIEQAIQDGQTNFDLMRGDEEYKLKFRAQPVSTFDIRAVSPKVSAVLRSRARTCLKSVYRAAQLTIATSVSAFASMSALAKSASGDMN